MSGLRRDQRIEVTVERAVYRGQGLARHEGQVVFVPRGLPGDVLRVRVASVTPGYVKAEIEEVVTAGPGRSDARCPYFAQCGGCAYQHLDPAAQAALKESVLRDALRRAGTAWEGPIVVRPSPPEGWRTRATLHVEQGRDGVRLGFHREASHDVVDIERCLQLSAPMMAGARGLRDALAARPGLARAVRDVELAESFDGRRLVASLETTLDPKEASGAASLGDAVPSLTGLGLVAGEGRRRRFLLLRGDAHVDATVHGLHLRAHVQSFFQANRFLVDALVQEVLDRTPAGGSVLDLYAGVGLFALPLGRRAEEVRGLELSPNAVEDARANAAAAGLSHVRIHSGDVREMAELPPRPDERIVLDPPRTGAGADVVRMVAARKPSSVVYVSCDPPTLGRDLKVFAAEGYAPDSIAAFDLFPDTFHVETVVHLAPRRGL
ncbi:MAG TPA: class I SAM-dependent RNA methyltransferase [Vicinamibacteria bacterium]|nr:class I SAM-dependent RNA methyltransferase [Vicinamibacteria bacterium]